MNRMETIHNHNGVALSEQRPYRECPFCGEHQFRVVIKERRNGGILAELLARDTWEVMDRYEECKNCKHIERNHE